MRLKENRTEGIYGKGRSISERPKGEMFCQSVNRDTGKMADYPLSRVLQSVPRIPKIYPKCPERPGPIRGKGLPGKIMKPKAEGPKDDRLRLERSFLPERFLLIFLDFWKIPNYN